MPESKTPIGWGAIFDPVFWWALFTGTDRNGWGMMVLDLGRRVGPQRFANWPSMRGQVDLSHCEVRSLRPIIHRGIIILDAQRYRGAEPLPVITCRNALSLDGIADKTALHQDGRNLYVSQDMKPGMAYAPVERRQP